MMENKSRRNSRRSGHTFLMDPLWRTLRGAVSVRPKRISTEAANALYLLIAKKVAFEIGNIRELRKVATTRTRTRTTCRSVLWKSQLRIVDRGNYGRTERALHSRNLGHPQRRGEFIEENRPEQGAVTGYTAGRAVPI